MTLLSEIRGLPRAARLSEGRNNRADIWEKTQTQIYMN